MTRHLPTRCEADISALDAFEGEKHRGARGNRDWLLNTEGTIETESRLEQITEIDKDRVLAIIPTSVRGKLSGVALKEERWASIVTVRGGKIIRSEVYRSSDEALKAVEREG